MSGKGSGSEKLSKVQGIAYYLTGMENCTDVKKKLTVKLNDLLLPQLVVVEGSTLREELANDLTGIVTSVRVRILKQASQESYQQNLQKNRWWNGGTWLLSGHLHFLSTTLYTS